MAAMGGTTTGISGSGGTMLQHKQVNSPPPKFASDQISDASSDDVLEVWTPPPPMKPKSQTPPTRAGLATSVTSEKKKPPPPTSSQQQATIATGGGGASGGGPPFFPPQDHQPQYYYHPSHPPPQYRYPHPPSHPPPHYGVHQQPMPSSYPNPYIPSGPLHHAPQPTFHPPSPYFDGGGGAGGHYRSPGKQFESRPSSAPVRFPEAHKKTTASKIPDDLEESHETSSTTPNNSNAAATLNSNRSSVNDKNIGQNPKPHIPQHQATNNKPANKPAGPRAQLLEAVRPKRATARKRETVDSRVDYVSEWNPKTKIWEESVYDQEQQKLVQCNDDDDEILCEHPGYDITKKSKQRKRGNRRQQRKSRKKKKKDDDEETNNGPSISNVYFDSRYLQWDKNPRGVEGRLLPPSIVQQADAKPCDATFLRRIPDDPVLPSSSSRVGYEYQARVAAFGEYYNDKFEDDYLPEYDTLWDPQRAKEAEQRGEDIEGFLSGDHELVKMQCLMQLLHRCDYNVETARNEYDRVVKFSGEATSKMNQDEGRKFERLLKRNRKDFNMLSVAMSRSPADCMIYYYRWKGSTRNQYMSLKTEWKSDWCAICDDGGEMIVCDSCERSYHMECLDPPVKKIPEGDWHCPRCSTSPSLDADGGHKPRQPFSPFSHGRSSKPHHYGHHHGHHHHLTSATSHTATGRTLSDVIDVDKDDDEDDNEVVVIENEAVNGVEGGDGLHWAFQPNTFALTAVDNDNDNDNDNNNNQGSRALDFS